jgi:D-methionine transport system ATP-binding protein
VSLLGASIETVNGNTVGHATVGLRSRDEYTVVEAAARLGLDARPSRTDGIRSAYADPIDAERELVA